MSGPRLRVSFGFDALAARLTARAAEIAAARAATHDRAARHDARRWRRAALVWPGFAKG